MRGYIHYKKGGFVSHSLWLSELQTNLCNIDPVGSSLFMHITANNSKPYSTPLVTSCSLEFRSHIKVSF